MDSGDGAPVSRFTSALIAVLLILAAAAMLAVTVASSCFAPTSRLFCSGSSRVISFVP